METRMVAEAAMPMVRSVVPFGEHAALLTFRLFQPHTNSIFLLSYSVLFLTAGNANGNGT